MLLIPHGADEHSTLELAIHGSIFKNKNATCSGKRLAPNPRPGLTSMAYQSLVL